MKEKTIYYLQLHIDELHNNMLAIKMTDENYALNQASIFEIKKCIEWVKNK